MPASAGQEKVALIALGSNLPFRALAGDALFDAAIAALEEGGLRVLARSTTHSTPAWPPSDQPDYANAAIAADPGALGPHDLLALLLETERRFGRERRGRWAARTLDLDLLDYAGQILDSPALTLPHPRLHERAFVLAPLAEIAPAWRHPVLGKTGAELLVRLPQTQSS